MWVRVRGAGLDVRLLPALRQHPGLVAPGGNQALLADSEIVAFVGTDDPERSRQFYERCLGLPLIDQTPFACVFQAPNAQIRVAVVPHPARAPYTVLGWLVDDIDAAAASLRERGIQTLRYDGLDQDELGVWRSPSGARVVWFSDPDGNLLSLTAA